MLAETEGERVTLSTPNRKLSYGVEARKTVLPCYYYYVRYSRAEKTINNNFHAVAQRCQYELSRMGLKVVVQKK